MTGNNQDSSGVDKVLLAELARGAQITFANAEALYNEASFLRGQGRLSRALFLHQISLEECAKIEILGAFATSLLMGHDVDFEKVQKGLASHAHKNRTNAYFLNASAEEESAKQAGDFDAALAAFKQMQKAFHLKANTAKNAALYVDFKDQKFVAPDECITLEMAAEIAALNEEFLGLSSPKIEMLQKWLENPVVPTDDAKYFQKRIEELATEHPNDPSKALELVMKEMLERIRQRPCK